jgi:hypothetical protein
MVLAATSCYMVQAHSQSYYQLDLTNPYYSNLAKSGKMSYTIFEEDIIEIIVSETESNKWFLRQYYD